jgi:two-component system NtrC family sensor kinase
MIPPAAEPAPPVDHRTAARPVQLQRRLAAMKGGASAVITVLMVAAVWGAWRTVAVVLTLHLLLIAFNVWVNRATLVAGDRQRTAIERANHELRAAHEQLAAATDHRLHAETELRQAQKLEAVGRLASGVAHEINTPVQFVNDSVHFLRDAMHDLMVVVEKLQAVRRAVEDGTAAAAVAVAAAEAEEAADLPYLAVHVPKALERSIDGLGRVAAIVRSMKELAHPEAREMVAVDLNRAIQSTLTIARHEYKYVADVETDLGELPAVLCHGGDLNQALLNIVVNAAHAIDDVVRGTERRGRITVKTRCHGDDVVIAIGDTGAGIPEDIRDRIFDPFFTTKAVGQGTGQGLAIARSVIVDHHGGELRVESTMGHGTTFIIRIPVTGAAHLTAADGAAA